MTHPTTEPNIRERLARRLASKRLPAMNLTDEAREMLIQQDLYHARADVDAILAELENPSEGEIQAACDATFGPMPLTPEEMHTMGRQAMIQHIRDGGK